MKIQVLIFLFILAGGSAGAHSGKPKYHVVIDTDGAIDDMRAISMLLSANDIRVLAITCSQGTLPPQTVFNKVQALLSAFHHEGIPVGIGRQTDFEPPEWAGFAENVFWGASEDEHKQDYQDHAVPLLNNILKDYPDNVVLIALGSLLTYAELIKHNPGVKEQTERIIWYNDHEIEQGFNYCVSPESYEFIQESGITIDIVGNPREKLPLNDAYLNEIKNANSLYAAQIRDVHSQKPVAERVNMGLMRLWDDLVPLYLTLPVLFEVQTENDIKRVSLMESLPEEYIYELVGKLLVSATASVNRVFSEFPVDATLYLPAYRSILDQTVEKYGLIEWKAITLTNEIHGHTGIYSIIGAKMGIRAMEYFNVGVNNLKVITYAGNDPPVSCFNDGIQVSTGATIGQGLISVSDSISIIPSAQFEFNNQKIIISLKPEIAGQMRAEIAYGELNFGILTDQYWLYIEKRAITYWTDFNRQEIFIISRVN
ncbi:MAG: nucleoside hydrolase [Bacteroidales bacterium]|nr:nucleoside hydrolase [Bacteroidales bacterium]MBN2698403.1 nucleoside hydrolase [Bacteroidales bacterium]